MPLKPLFFFLLGCMLHTSAVFGQLFYNDQFMTPIDSIERGALSVEVLTDGYFKNNEYFSVRDAGTSVLGIQTLNALRYDVSNKLSIKGGFYLNWVHGLSGFLNAAPHIQMRYQFTPHVNLLVGTLNGNVNHNTNDVLWRFDNYITDFQETGIQILVDKNRFKGDFWLDWQQFIQRDDPFRERFMVGFHTEYDVMKEPIRTLRWLTDIQVTHRGGQVDQSSEPVIFDYTGSTGFIGFKERTGRIKIIGAGLHGYATLSNFKPGSENNPENPGLAYDFKLFLKGKHVFASLNYFQGRHVIVPRGEQLLQEVSFNPSNPSFSYAGIAVTKFSYTKTLERGFTLTARVELFYDVVEHTRDYNFGVFMLFRDKFTIRKNAHRTRNMSRVI